MIYNYLINNKKMYFNKGMMKNMRKNIKGTHKMKGKYTKWIIL